MKITDLIETTRHPRWRMGRKRGCYYSAHFLGTGLAAQGDTREAAEAALLDLVRERLNFDEIRVLPANDHDVIVVDGPASYQFHRRVAGPQSPLAASSSVHTEHPLRAARLHAAQLRIDMPHLGFDVLPTNDPGLWVEHAAYVAMSMANAAATVRGFSNNGPGTNGYAFAEPWAAACMFRINNNEYRISHAATVLDIRRGTGAEIEFVDGSYNRTTILPPREVG